MAATIPPSPSLGDIQAVLRSGDQRAQQAAMAIKPPDRVDPQDVAVVMEAVRKTDDPRPGGIDIIV